MTYAVEAWSISGEPLADLGSFNNIIAARQSMLDHSGTIDLPSENPWHGPDIGVLEGWFIGRTEYLIRNGAQCGCKSPCACN